VVAAVVIGRHVNRNWHENDRRLRALPRFDWGRCALCAPAAAPIQPPSATAEASRPAVARKATPA
jgi:hypothetical protein